MSVSESQSAELPDQRLKFAVQTAFQRGGLSFEFSPTTVRKLFSQFGGAGCEDPRLIDQAFRAFQKV